MPPSPSIARTELWSWWFNRIFVTAFICSRVAWWCGRTEMNLLSCATALPCCDWARKSVPHRSRSWKRSSTPKMLTCSSKRGEMCYWVWIEHWCDSRNARVCIWDGLAASNPQLESLKVCHCQATPTSETHRFKKWPQFVRFEPSKFPRYFASAPDPHPGNGRFSTHHGRVLWYVQLLGVKGDFLVNLVSWCLILYEGYICGIERLSGGAPPSPTSLTLSTGSSRHNHYLLQYSRAMISALICICDIYINTGLVNSGCDARYPVILAASLTLCQVVN